MCANMGGRPAAEGYAACCRTCTQSSAKRHGPRCEKAYAKSSSSGKVPFMTSNTHTTRKDISRSPRRRSGSIEECIMPVDRIDYSQGNCSRCFRDGKPLDQLVTELMEGRWDPESAHFLKLECIRKAGRHGETSLLSNDNRRLWCLKKYQELLRKHRNNQAEEVRVRVSISDAGDLQPQFRRFLQRYDPTYGGQSIKVRGREG
eukprot:TRINITY_DN48753_c0_g1_i1.p1 TRINITY_DN48753_c0_g1~~TRINITY_DN48753_c0_g1_i1.p1  ORF type:complete len:213 (-),score=3.55 TRINITY_DN48753_c0_g1_i1:38-646(-)